MPEESTPNQKGSKNDGDNLDISLSAAILAPLNAIFEAQVHAARAFLNFILQMGFRHEYTPEDKAELNKDREKNKVILDEIEKRDIDKKRIAELEKRSDLDEKERNELWNLKLRSDDMILQRFDLFSDKGDNSSVFIPNLAILPIKPLAIDNANFKFQLTVKKCTQEYDQLRKVEGTAKDRPWFLIKPKHIEGQFYKGDEKEESIKIEVNIGSTDMPEGLDKLSTSLTNSSKIIPRTTIKNEETEIK